MPITDARLLGPKGSQDDIVLDLGEGSSRHPAVAAPHSAPRRLTSSPAASNSNDIQPSPTKHLKANQTAKDSKGKAKEKDYQPTDSFLKRLAGPSTGKAGLLRDPEEVRKIVCQC